MIEIVEIIGDFCVGEIVEFVLEIIGGEVFYVGGVFYVDEVQVSFSNEFNIILSVFIIFFIVIIYGYIGLLVFVLDVNNCLFGVIFLFFFE